MPETLTFRITAVDETAAAVRTARSNLAGVGDAARKAGADTEDAAKRGSRSLQALGRDAQSTGRSMQDLGRAIGAAGLGAATIAFGRAIVQAATSMDSLKRGLTAVSGSAGAAEAQLIRLREVAKLPGLGFEEAVRGAIRLQAAGLSAQLAERALKAFGNALATVGSGKAELNGVIVALTQIQSKGKIAAQEINQLAERVPQIRIAIQGAFGTADTEELGKRGIGATEFITRIIEQLEKLPKATGGAANEFENLQDAVKALFTTLGNAILPQTGRIVKDLGAMAEKAAEAFGKLSDSAQRGLVGGGLGLGAAAGALGGLGMMAGGLRSIRGLFGGGAGLAAGAGAAAGGAAAAGAGGLGGFLVSRVLPAAAAFEVGHGIGNLINESQIGANEAAARNTSASISDKARRLVTVAQLARRDPRYRPLAEQLARELREARTGKTEAPPITTSSGTTEGAFDAAEAAAKFAGGDTAAGQLRALRPVLQARLADLRKQGQKATGDELHKLEKEYWQTRREIAELERAAQKEVDEAKEKALHAAEKAAHEAQQRYREGLRLQKAAFDAQKHAADEMRRAAEEATHRAEQFEREEFQHAQARTRGAVGAVGAGVDLAKARAAVIGGLDPLAGKAAQQGMVVPALLRQLRATGVPIPGESDEDLIRRQIEAERLKGEILGLSGIGGGSSVSLAGGGSIDLFDRRGPAALAQLDRTQRGAQINIGNIQLGGSETQYRQQWLQAYDYYIRPALGGL